MGLWHSVRTVYAVGQKIVDNCMFCAHVSSSTKEISKSKKCKLKSEIRRIVEPFQLKIKEAVTRDFYLYFFHQERP